MYCCCAADESSDLVNLHPVSEGAVLVETSGPKALPVLSDNPPARSNQVKEEKASVAPVVEERNSTVVQEPLTLAPDEKLSLNAQPARNRSVADKPSGQALAPSVEEQKQPEKTDAAAVIAKTEALEFKVDVGKDSKYASLGVELDAVGGVYAMVIKVSEGALSRYNALTTPDLRVQVGDFIMGVNGTTGDTKKMAQLCIDQLELELRFKRAVPFSVTIDKTSAQNSLGLDLDYLDAGISLHIRDIKDGLIGDWNRTQKDREVKSCDRIVSVNGFRGEAKKLLEMCAGQGKLELEICRP